jgi:hypothetical protein
MDSMLTHSGHDNAPDQERVGVQEEEGFLVMQKSDAFTEKALLEGAGEVLNSAMTNPMFGVL